MTGSVQPGRSCGSKNWRNAVHDIPCIAREWQEQEIGITDTIATRLRTRTQMN
jgi:hypothetical protein